MSASTRFRPLGRRLPAALLALSVLGSASTVGATQRNWSPAASPCGPSLQNCVNFAAAGDTINIVFSGSIPEDLMITKSLTVRAAAGHTPLFVDFPLINLWNEIGDQNVFRLEGLRFDHGRIVAIQFGLQPLIVTLRNLEMTDTVNGNPQVTLRTDQSGAPGPWGPMLAQIEDSRFTIPAGSQFSGAEVLSMQAGTANAMTVIIRNNQIRHFDGQQLAAVAIFNETSHVVADVIGNDIRGDNYNSGVSFFQYAAGSAQLRILGNLISGQVDDAGAPAGISVSITEGQASFEIVNNSIVQCDNGIMINGLSGAGSVDSGIIANNLVASMADAGIGIDYPGPTDGNVINEHNLIHDVRLNFFVPGPGTVFADPQFVAADLYHITSDSPARNAGSNTRVPGDLTRDLDGDARKIGVVDIGADESTVTVSAPPNVSGSYALDPNAPNPFNPTTLIRYHLPRAERVFLGVYDARGELIRWLVEGDARGPGRHSATWDGRDRQGVSMASGIYFYRLTAGTFTESRRMALVR